ncbi:MAG: hypothetical protein M3Z04_13895 [Chloroflexota bacterium]|nr:hypothetical protein [Chloroflexota bacterium]
MGGDITQQDVLALLGRLTGQASVLTIPRLFIEMTGSLEAALLLSQCLYWTPRTSDPDGWFYKTAEEWEAELSLSEYQVRKARKVLEPFGLQTEVRAVQNVPKLHYRIDGPQLYKCILKKLQNAPASLSSEHSEKTTETTDTEITSKITQENDSNHPAPQKPRRNGRTSADTSASAEAAALPVAPRDTPAAPYSAYLAGVIFDHSTELGDAVHKAANSTQAHRLWHASGLDEAAFAALLHEARRLVRENQGKQGRGTIANKMAYYFRVLADLAGVPTELGAGR